MHAPRAAVKLPQSFTVPQPYHNTNGVSFVTILSCEGFCSCRKENLGVGAAGRNPRRENSALALTNISMGAQGLAGGAVRNELGALAAGASIVGVALDNVAVAGRCWGSAADASLVTSGDVRGVTFACPATSG